MIVLNIGSSLLQSSLPAASLAYGGTRRNGPAPRLRSVVITLLTGPRVLGLALPLTDVMCGQLRRPTGLLPDADCAGCGLGSSRHLRSRKEVSHAWNTDTWEPFAELAELRSR